MPCIAKNVLKSRLTTTNRIRSRKGKIASGIIQPCITMTRRYNNEILLLIIYIYICCGNPLSSYLYSQNPLNKHHTNYEVTRAAGGKGERDGAQADYKMWFQNLSTYAFALYCPEDGFLPPYFLRGMIKRLGEQGISKGVFIDGATRIRHAVSALWNLCLRAMHTLGSILTVLGNFIMRHVIVEVSL